MRKVRFSASVRVYEARRAKAATTRTGYQPCTFSLQISLTAGKTRWARSVDRDHCANRSRLFRSRRKHTSGYANFSVEPQTPPDSEPSRRILFGRSRSSSIVLRRASGPLEPSEMGDWSRTLMRTLSNLAGSIFAKSSKKPGGKLESRT